MDKIELFDYVRNFCEDKVDLRKHPAYLDNYKKTRFMINRVLSMSPKTCHLALFMSVYNDVPSDMHFLFLNAEIDREKIFFNYCKETNEIPKKHKKWFQEYFQCSAERAISYWNLMSEKQRETILEPYILREENDKTPKRKKSK